MAGSPLATWEMRAMRMCNTEAEALEAVGLSEQDAHADS